jgi:hypothetical protein
MILEYFSLGKGSLTGPWGRLEKFVKSYVIIIPFWLDVDLGLLKCFCHFQQQFSFIIPGASEQCFKVRFFR